MTPADAREDLPATVATPRTLLLLATMATLVLVSSLMVYTWIATWRRESVETDHLVPGTIWGLGGVGLTAVLAAAVLVGMRRRAEHTHGLTPLGPPERGEDGLAGVRRRVAEVAERLGVADGYLLRGAPLDDRLAAHVRLGRDRRPVVVLSGGLMKCFFAEPETFDAVVAHELAHVRNRDVLPTAVAIAAWRATVLVGVLPWAFFLLFQLNSWYGRVSGVLLIAIVFLIRLSVLRSREYWADVRSAQAGFGAQVAAVLARTPHGPGRRRPLVSFHPARRSRLAALRSESLAPHVVSLEGAFLAGVTLGICIGGLAPFFSNPLSAWLEPVTAAWVSFVLPLVPALPFVVVVARAAGFAEARWTGGGAVATLMAVAVGGGLGSSVALGFGVSGPSDALSWLGVQRDHAGTWAPALSVALFFVIAALVVGWSRGVTVVWWDVAARSRAFRVGLDAVVVMATILMFNLVQTLTWKVLQDGDWSTQEAVTNDAAAAAATAPWNVVPYWARELDSGSLWTLMADLGGIFAGVLAVAVPLLGVLRNRRRALRALLGALTALVAIELFTNGLGLAVLATSSSLDPAVLTQLSHNLNEGAYFVELLAGGVVAFGVGLLLARTPAVVGIAAGTVLTAAALTVHVFTRPLRCLLASNVVGMCAPGWSVSETMLIAVETLAPSMLFCVVAAALGRGIAAGVRALARPSSGGPEPDAPSLAPA